MPETTIWSPSVVIAVVMSVAAEPASGSEIATASVTSPRAIGGRKRSCCSSVPKRSMTRAGPVEASKIGNAAAHKAASAYYSAAKARLTEASWTDDYDLTLAVHVGLAECYFLSGGFDDADRLCEIVIAHARANIDAAPAYHLQIRVANATVNNAKSLAIGFAYLRLLGLDQERAALAERDRRQQRTEDDGAAQHVQ